MLKNIFVGLGFIILIGLSVAYYGYSAVYQDNINDDTTLEYLSIPTGSSFNDVMNILTEHNVLRDKSSFRQVAKLMSYSNESVPSGRYALDKSYSSRELISLLRSGRQTPVKVTFNNHRTLNETLGNISQYLEHDSIEYTDYFNKTETLDRAGLTKECLLTMFIPNTYEMYWNTSPEKLFSRMKVEHQKFWERNDRMTKAKHQGLTPEEVFTLASIVEKESQVAKERPIIAGLYLNRLKKGIPLQADPTVVFAVGDFSIRRVLNKHLRVDSPFNTYKNQGLPPGPIYLPSIQSIDAVLNPAQHDYLFMCAKPGYNSEHAFAKTAREHSRNAQRYRSWLTSEGIR